MPAVKPEKCPEGTSQTVVAATGDGGGNVQRERECGVFGFSTHAQSFQHMGTCLCVYTQVYTQAHNVMHVQLHVHVHCACIFTVHTHVQCTCRCATMYMFIAMAIFQSQVILKIATMGFAMSFDFLECLSLATYLIHLHFHEHTVVSTTASRPTPPTSSPR